MIVLGLFIFAWYKRCIKKDLNREIELRISDAIQQYEVMQTLENDSQAGFQPGDGIFQNQT